MMTNKLLSKAVLLALCFTVFLPRLSDGFNGKAHERLSKLAVDPTLANASQLDSFLKSVLGFEFRLGKNQLVGGGRTVEDLIADGSINEDEPFPRVFHHFHDPTRPWNSAGFRWLTGTWLSSIQWSQLTTPQPYGETRTWKTARDAYFNALTSTSVSQRKQWYAETFRTLGHLIHHVQDAAVPAHTRNDLHPAASEKTTIPLGDRFHNWADANLAKINESIQLSGIMRFTPSVLDQATPNPLAPVPVARIIDKTDNDFGVLSPNLNIGLAEYSNANFFSEHTVLSTAYQYPRLSQLEIRPPENLPNGIRRRYAYFRPGFGQQDYRLSTWSSMMPYMGSALPLEVVDIGFDDNVFADYGRKLFPRAIGYSAGLIDYFFRAKVDTTTPSTGGWPLGWVPWANRPTSIPLDQVKVTVSGGGTPTGSGTIRLVLWHGYAFDPRPIFDGGYYVSGESTHLTTPAVVVSQPVPFSITAQYQSVTFPFDALPFPIEYPAGGGCCDGHWYFGLLVYQGTIDNEQNVAIAASVYCDGPGFRYELDYIFQRSATHAGASGLC